jgi:hypothetical protein
VEDMKVSEEFSAAIFRVNDGEDEDRGIRFIRKVI